MSPPLASHGFGAAADAASSNARFSAKPPSLQNLRGENACKRRGKRLPSLTPPKRRKVRAGTHIAYIVLALLMRRIFICRLCSNVFPSLLIIVHSSPTVVAEASITVL